MRACSCPSRFEAPADVESFPALPLWAVRSTGNPGGRLLPLTSKNLSALWPVVNKCRHCILHCPLYDVVRQLVIPFAQCRSGSRRRSFELFALSLATASIEPLCIF